MKLVIFDLDGVIVSTDRFHYAAWKIIADQMEMKFDERMNHQLRGVSRRESLEIILNNNNKHVDEKTILTLLESKNEVYRQSLEALTGMDILPGVLHLLETLKVHHIKVAVGSSSKNTPMILQRIGLSDAFDTIVDGNDIKYSKPHPEVFLKCAQNLSIRPEDSVVIEDAIAGVEAAIAAGMKVLAVGPHELSKATAWLTSLKGLNNFALEKLIF